MATYDEVLAARDIALKLFQDMGVRAAVGVTKAGLWDRMTHPELKLIDTETDFVLAVRIQEKTDLELPRTIEGIPAEYAFIGIVQLQ